MNCKLCKIKDRTDLLTMMKLYEDDRIIAVLSKKPATICHVIIFPKIHYTIMEQVPDDIVGHAFIVASKISRAMFESLNIQGTNIFVQNGATAGQEDPHFSVHIISRGENDNVKLEWQPKKMSEEQLSTVELTYKDITGGTVYNQDEKEVVKEPEAKKEDKGDKYDEEGEGDNYKLKYFNKLP